MGLREQEQPRYLGRHDRYENRPLHRAYEPVASGRLLLGALLLCLDVWLLGVLAARWLS